MTAFREMHAQTAGAPSRVAVLLTSAGQRVALVNSLRTVGAELGLKVRVIACDRSPRNRPACLVADAAYQTPDADAPGYIAALLEICVVHRVKLIIPTDAAEMGVLGRSRAQFAAIGVSIAGGGPSLAGGAGDAARLQELAVTALPVSPDGDGPEPLSEEERRFEVLMYFDRRGDLRTVIPCERVALDGVEHLITRHCPELEELAEQLAEQLEEPRSVVSFDARLLPGSPVQIEGLRTYFGETFEIAQLAGAQLIRWLLSEHCLDQPAPVAEWRGGVEMFRYQAAMFVLPR